MKKVAKSEKALHFNQPAPFLPLKHKDTKAHKKINYLTNLLMPPPIFGTLKFIKNPKRLLVNFK
jgi:hypothetical protein